MVNRANEEPVDVRGRILEVAGSLFSEQGFDATSVRQIAELVGVTVPALYYHFGSKAGILRAAVGEHLERKEKLIEAAGRPPGSAPARLREALRSYSRFLAEEHSATKIILRDPRLLADKELFLLVRQSDQRAARMLSAILEDGAAEGAFRPVEPGLTSHLLLAAVRSSILSPTVAALQENGDRVAEAMLTLLIEGLLER